MTTTTTDICTKKEERKVVLVQKSPRDFLIYPFFKVPMDWLHVFG
jgi:hypothetical protein